MACDTEIANPIHRLMRRRAPRASNSVESIGAGQRRCAILPGMAIEIVPLILLPTMDSERFERCSFSLQDAVSTLTITMTDLPPFLIHFDRLRWHRCTPHAECGPGLVQGCDMAVAEVHESPALKAYVQREGVPERDAAALRREGVLVWRL